LVQVGPEERSRMLRWGMDREEWTVSAVFALMIAAVAFFGWSTIATGLECQSLGYPDSAWYPTARYCGVTVRQTSYVVTLDYARKHPRPAAVEP